MSQKAANLVCRKGRQIYLVHCTISKRVCIDSFENFLLIFQFFLIFFHFLIGRELTIREKLRKITGLCYCRPLQQEMVRLKLWRTISYFWGDCTSIIVRRRVLVERAAMPTAITNAMSTSTNELYPNAYANIAPTELFGAR